MMSGRDKPMFLRKKGSIFKTVRATVTITSTKISVWARKKPFVSTTYDVRVDARDNLKVGNGYESKKQTGPTLSEEVAFPPGLYRVEGKREDVLRSLKTTNPMDTERNTLGEFIRKAVDVVTKVAREIGDIK